MPGSEVGGCIWGASGRRRCLGAMRGEPGLHGGQRGGCLGGGELVVGGQGPRAAYCAR